MTVGSAFADFTDRARAGDEQAAPELVRRYEPLIRREVRLHLEDRRLARLFDSMDVCQSVLGSFFVRAALGQFDLQTPEQLLNLLVTMSRRKVADAAREAGAARRDYRREQAGVEAAQALDRGATPSQEVAGAELLVEFRRRLSADERLLADQRAAGLEWEQIAAQRGASPEALRKQLTRAIDRVAQELGLESAPS